MDTTNLVVIRWRRYGKDRLYVAASDETTVGFWDLVADEGHPATPEDAERLAAAVQQWRESVAPPPLEGPEPELTGSTATVPAPIAEFLHGPEPTTPTEAPPEKPWLDLGRNRAGAQAREQALAARRAAPVRTFLDRIRGVHTDERAWRLGADGEEKVAAKLDRVHTKDPRWHFLHAVPVGDRGSDIDHLAIGPGGVFTINAKHHRGASIWIGGGTLMVNGARHPYLRNSRYEANRAAALLAEACGFPVHVEAVIALVNPGGITIKKTPEGAHVCKHSALPEWLLRHGELLSDDVVSAVHAAARRSTTWGH